MGYDGPVIDGDRDIGGALGSGVRSLRAVRADRLLSLRELAYLAGVAASTIYLIEAGRTTPRPAMIRRLSAALGVEPWAVAEFRRAIHDRAAAC